MTDRILWDRPHHRRPRRKFRQLIHLRFLMASAHTGTDNVLDHHIRGAHQPHRNLDRPTYLVTAM